MSATKSYCDLCIRENVRLRYKGTVFCSDCLETLCMVCERHHKKNKASLDHKLINLRTETGQTTLKQNVFKHDANEMKQKLKAMDHTVEMLLQHEANFRTKLDEEKKDEAYCMDKVKGHIDYSFEKVKTDVLTETSTRRNQLTIASLSQTEYLEELKGEITRSNDVFENASLQHEIPRSAMYGELDKELSEYESRINKHKIKASSLYFCVVDSASCLDIYRRLEKCFRIENVTDELEYQVEMTQLYTRKTPRINFVGDKVVDCVKIIELPERRTTPRYCVWIDKYIIVSLQEEQTLEMFDTITGAFISRYVWKSQPWAITRVDNANFAVAFPNEKTITLMTVLNKYMKIKNGSTPVQTSLEVSAVAYNSEGQIIYAASMTDGSHIEKYDVQGKVHGAVFLENSSGGIYNITYDSKLKYLFASCHEPDKVVCLDINGTNIFEYSEETLKKPWSVVLDDTDNVYITSYKGQCIHQLNKKGILKNKVVSSNGKAFTHPLGMCFNQYKNRFVLSFAESATMQIFKL